MKPLRLRTGRVVPIMAAAFLQVSCQPSADPQPRETAPSTPPSVAPSGPTAAAPATQTFVALGTEPFWAADISPTALLYKTPENQKGVSIKGQGVATPAGMRFTASYQGEPFVAEVSKASCSDGMSDRTYAYQVRLKIGAETRQGCATAQ